MACADENVLLEARMVEALGVVASFERTTSSLTLLDDAGTILMRLSPTG
jgi:heat shock protein HslJ